VFADILGKINMKNTLRKIFKKQTNHPQNSGDWFEAGSQIKFSDLSESAPQRGSTNPLETYFAELKTGPGIWKWLHYFNAYDCHLAKFRTHPVNMMEIGVYSGGSLNMWRAYLHEQSHIIGVDIEPTCRSYEDAKTTIVIGDQADRGFWQRTKASLPPLDIVIDDGGHQPQQQQVSFEELFPHLNSGGIYICEDIHGTGNDFAKYLFGFTDQLNAMNGFKESLDDAENRLTVSPTDIQKYVRAIHFYPFIAVIERNDSPVHLMRAAKHGTDWEPFLS
jgi:hypothetical protein